MTEISAPDLEKYKLYYPVELTDRLYCLIRDASVQKRDANLMARHLFLDQAAQQKAADMVRLGYFSHTSPLGVSANQNVRNSGYLLPDSYSVTGNDVESFYVGTDRPQDAAAAWYASDPDRPHVYGQNAFFRGQNCIGVGYAPLPKEEHRGYWVFLSAPCSS